MMLGIKTSRNDPDVQRETLRLRCTCKGGKFAQRISSAPNLTWRADAASLSEVAETIGAAL
jgi:hypothetical protein